MAEKIDATMATSIALDTLKASSSINSLTKVVRSSTSAWKSNEAQLKSNGEYLKASQVRYEGLGKSINSQKTVIEALKNKMSEFNANTSDGAKKIVEYQTKIDTATTKLKSMEAQQQRASTDMERQKSGIVDLTVAMGRRNVLSDAYVKRLESEGNHTKALEAQRDNAKKSITDTTKALEAEQNILKKMEGSGASDSSINKQRIAVEKLKTALNESKRDVNKFDDSIRHINPTPLDRLKNSLSKVVGSADKSSHSLRNMAIGSTIGNSISNGLSTAVSWIKNVTKQGYELAEAGGTIKKQWTNLGLSDSEAKKMTAQISDIRSKANMSGGAIDQMQKKFYAMTNSTSKARAMTEVLTSYGSAAGKSSDQIAGLTQGVAKLAGSSKVTASLFKRNFSQVPELQKAIIKASGMSTDAFNKQLAAGKITGSQLQGYMVKAAKTSGKAWSEFGDTTKGKMAAIQGTYTNLKVAFAKPLVAGVEKAIDGISEKKGALDNVKKSLTGLVGTLGKKTGQYVGDVIKFLAKNKKPIEKIGGALASIVGSLAKGAWNTVAGALKLIGGHSKDASKGLSGIANATANISKHQGAIKAIGSAIVTYLAVSKMMTVARGVITIAKAFGTLTSFMLANPIVLIGAAIVGLGVAFYEAYKHIKPFREWVNKTFKSVVNFGKGIAKWGSNAVKSVGKSLSNMSKKWNSFKNSFRKAWNSHWAAIGKSLKNIWNSSIKNIKNFFSNIVKGFSSFSKSFKKAWNNMWNSVKRFFSNIFNGIHKTFKSWTSAISRAWNGFKNWFGKTWHGMWNGIHDFFHGITKSLSKIFSGWISGTMGALGSFGKKFTSGWNGLVKGVKDIFSGLWKDLKGFARDGMNDVIDIINSGINAVDSVIHAFGGKRKTIADLGHVHFATGTGVFSGSRNPITKPTMAMLNDGNDSPQTGNKEMVMLPNGDSGIVQGRNTKMMLPAGTEVLSASETAMLMAMQGVTKYAKGTGFFGDILNSVTSGISGVTSWIGKKVGSLEKFFKTAENIIAHPIKSLENLFSWSSKGVSGVMSNIGHGLFEDVEKQVKSWWSTLWSMVDLDGAGGDATGLLKAVEKYGSGHPYVWAAGGPDSFDCSGLVMYALKHAFNIDYPHFSGAQYAMTQHISKDQATAGDLVFWGPGEHVGVYAGHDKYFSALSPHNHPNIGMENIYTGGGTGKMLFGRVKGLSHNKDKKKNLNLKGIKAQVGKGFWDFIDKIASIFGDAASPAGEGVDRWIPHIKSIASEMHVSLGGGLLDRILNTMKHESGGDPTVWQHGYTDVNTGVDPARGLFQFIGSTFRHYAMPGHTNRANGDDQIRALLNDAGIRNDLRWNGGWSPSGARRYANGGIAKVASIFGEKGPEMAIPLAATKNDRANQLLGETVVTLAKNQPNKLVANSDDSSNTDLSDLKDMLGQAVQLLNGVVTAIYQTALTEKDVSNISKQANALEKMKYNRSLGMR